MDGTLYLVLFLGFLVGGMMFVLVMAYMATEESRAREARERQAAGVSVIDAAVEIPAFFARQDVIRPALAAVEFDGAWIARLEDHVKAEQAVVGQFVRYPSIASLYRQSQSSLHVH